MGGVRLLRPQTGQATVELVAVIPAVVLVALIVWQLALAGQTAWLAANSARVAARASLVGEDTRAAARSSLPESLEDGLKVVEKDDGVEVRVPMPVLVRAWKSPLMVRARAGLEASP